MALSSIPWYVAAPIAFGPYLCSTNFLPDATHTSPSPEKTSMGNGRGMKKKNGTAESPCAHMSTRPILRPATDSVHLRC